MTTAAASLLLFSSAVRQYTSSSSLPGEKDSRQDVGELTAAEIQPFITRGDSRKQRVFSEPV